MRGHSPAEARNNLVFKFTQLSTARSPASPRKDRFLSSYGNNIFCHTCQTNQMLLTNLLSNYLPSPDVRSLHLCLWLVLMPFVGPGL